MPPRSARRSERRWLGIACDGERTAAVARQDHPDVPAVLDYRALLDRPDVDAADVVVPNDRHVEVATAALARGKDVLLEKPMASTVEGCDRLLAAARHSGRVLSIGHEFRLSTQGGTIRRLLDAGELGRPLYALVSLFRFPCVPGQAVHGAFLHQQDALFYNKTLFKEAGLTRPPQSFDELMDYARKMSKGEKSGLVTLNFDWLYWPLFATAPFPSPTMSWQNQRALEAACPLARRWSTV